MRRINFLTDKFNVSNYPIAASIRQILFVGSVLLVSVVPAFLSVRIRLLLVGLLFFLSAGYYLYFFTEIGIYLLITICLFIPFGLSTGTQTQLNLALLLFFTLMALWLLKMVLNRQFKFIVNRTFQPLYALVICSLISFGFGQIRWFTSTNAPITSQIGQLAIFLTSAGLFILTAHIVKNFKWLERYIIFFVIVIAAVVIIISVTSNINPRIYEFFLSITSQTGFGSITWLWAITLAFSQGFYNRALSWYWRFVLIISFFIVFYSLIVGSREWSSGWVPCLVSIGVIFFIGLPGRLRIISIMIAVLIAIWGFSYINSRLMSGNEYSLFTRLAAWKTLWNIIKVNPVFGLGMANYYFYTPLFSILGYNVRFNSHNNYIDIIAQIGFVGLSCYLWFIFEYAKLGLSLINRVPQGFLRAYVYGCIGGIAGTVVAGMLGDWVIPFVYNIGLSGFRFSMVGWAFLGVLVAIWYSIKISEKPLD